MAVACSPPKAQIPLFHQCTALLAACCCNLYNLYTSKQFQSPLCFVAGVIHTTHFLDLGEPGLYLILKFEESVIFFRRIERGQRGIRTFSRLLMHFFCHSDTQNHSFEVATYFFYDFNFIFIRAFYLRKYSSLKVKFETFFNLWWLFM